MKEKYIFRGHFENGELVYNIPDRLREVCYQHQGRGFVSELMLEYDKRTVKQNNYYWLYVDKYIRKIAEYSGHTKNELHMIFKCHFLEKERIEVFGKVFEIPGSTTKLSKQEFSELIERMSVLTRVPPPPIDDYI